MEIHLFDETDAFLFTTKVLFICRVFFGFRGNSEHTDLMCSSFKEGSYPESYPFFGMGPYLLGVFRGGVIRFLDARGV